MMPTARTDVSGLPRGGRIALVGMMAAGKTSNGRRLAAKTGIRFIDLDELIVERAGLSIPEIFARDGEPGFRKIESETLAATAAAEGPMILACGGGIVLAEANRKVLSESYFVVWLKVGVEEALRRAGPDGKGRPLLASPDREQTMRRLVRERTPIYESCSDLILDCDAPVGVEERALRLLSALQAARRLP